MAKVQSFTDNAGVVHASCYWRVAQINISVADGSAGITFYGYDDQTKREAGKAPVTGAVKRYVISSSDFATYYAQEIAKSKNIAEICYAFAMATKDVDTGRKDENNRPIMESFFEHATDA